MWTLVTCQWCREGFVPPFSVMCHTVFFELEVMFCKKVNSNQEMFSHGVSELMTLFFLPCEAAALSLELLMVHGPGARLAASVESGSGPRPGLTAGALPAVLQLSVLSASVPNGSLSHPASWVCGFRV